MGHTGATGSSQHRECVCAKSVLLKCGPLCEDQREKGLLQRCVTVCWWSAHLKRPITPIHCGWDRQVLIHTESSHLCRLNSWLSRLLWWSLLKLPVQMKQSFIYAQNKGTAWCCLLADCSHRRSCHRRLSSFTIPRERFEERFFIAQVLWHTVTRVPLACMEPWCRGVWPSWSHPPLARLTNEYAPHATASSLKRPLYYFPTFLRFLKMTVDEMRIIINPHRNWSQNMYFCSK